MSRHAVPFADTQYLSRTHSVFRAYGEDYAGRRLEILLSCPDTQCLSRLRRGLHGQAAGNFAFLPGHTVSFAPTARTTWAGGQF